MTTRLAFLVVLAVWADTSSGQPVDATSPLLEAVRVRDLAQVEKLIASGADVNAEHGQHGKWTALHEASRLGVADIAQCLLTAGATPDVLDHLQRTPTYLAACGDYIEVVRILSKAGVDPNTVTFRKLPLLHAVAEHGAIKVAELLIKNGADVNERNQAGLSPLHYAKTLEMAQNLLNAGADALALTDVGLTPLHFARSQRLAALFIERGCDLNVASSITGQTPLHVAVGNRRPEVVAYLLEVGASVDAVTVYGHTPLHLAATSAWMPATKLLVEHGADVNARFEEPQGRSGRSGWTPLHFAATARGMASAQYVGDHSSVIRILVENGADLAARDANQNTPLHIAALPDREKVFDILVANGADKSLKNFSGTTPVQVMRRVASGQRKKLIAVWTTKSTLALLWVLVLVAIIPWPMSHRRNRWVHFLPLVSLLLWGIYETSFPVSNPHQGSSGHMGGGRWDLLVLVPAVLLVFLAAALRFFILWTKMLLRRRRIRSGFCSKCKYDLRGSTLRCPECGTPIP